MFQGPLSPSSALLQLLHSSTGLQMSLFNSFMNFEEYKKLTFHPWLHQRFQIVFKEVGIKLAPVNKEKMKNLLNINIIIIRVFCPRAGLSLQTQGPRLQFCPKAGFSIANSGTKVAVLLGINKWSSFLLRPPLWSKW